MGTTTKAKPKSSRPKNIKFLPSMLILIDDNMGKLVRVLKNGSNTYLCIKNNNELVANFDFSDKPQYMKLQNLTRQYSDYGFRKLGETSQVPSEITQRLSDLPSNHFEDFYINDRPLNAKFVKFWSYIMNNRHRVDEVRELMVREGRFSEKTNNFKTCNSVASRNS